MHPVWLFDRDAAVEATALPVKRFSVASFMDSWTFNIERLQQHLCRRGSSSPSMTSARDRSGCGHDQRRSTAYIRPPLTSAETSERLAFTFCRMGTVGLVAWLVTPAVSVLVVALAAIVLYGRTMTLGASWSKCFLRQPTLIIGFWAVVAVADAAWLFALGGRRSA